MASNYQDDDDDVVFFEPQHETVEVQSDESFTPELATSRARKRSHGPELEPEVIEILDSDEEMTPSPDVVTKAPRLNVLDSDKAREVKAIIDEVIEMYKQDSKIDHSSSTAAIATIQSLQQYLEISSRKSDDFVSLRSLVADSGVVEVLFECLSKFTHHFQSVEKPAAEVEEPGPSTSRGRKKNAPKAKGKWTKTKDNGVGYGSGHQLGTSSNSSLKSKQAKLQNENVHVTSLLQFLASYINPEDEIPSIETSVIELPRTFIELLEQSCLAPVLRSYLRNDSILDMAQHVPLYRAVMLLVRAIAISSQIVHMLMMKHDESDETIADLCWKIKRNADAYSSRLT